MSYLTKRAMRSLRDAEVVRPPPKKSSASEDVPTQIERITVLISALDKRYNASIRHSKCSPEYALDTLAVGPLIAQYHQISWIVALARYVSDITDNIPCEYQHAVVIQRKQQYAATKP